MNEYLDRISEIIVDISGYEDEIKSEWDLVKKRIIKSVMLLEIISEIEEDYDIDVTPQDVYDGHFISINSMASYVLKKV
jgi:acyl carrier protein